VLVCFLNAVQMNFNITKLSYIVLEIRLIILSSCISVFVNPDGFFDICRLLFADRREKKGFF